MDPKIAHDGKLSYSITDSFLETPNRVDDIHTGYPFYKTNLFRLFMFPYVEGEGGQRVCKSQRTLEEILRSATFVQSPEAATHARETYKKLIQHETILSSI